MKLTTVLVHGQFLHGINKLPEFLITLHRNKFTMQDENQTLTNAENMDILVHHRTCYFFKKKNIVV